MAKEECLTFCGCEIKQQSNFDVLCSQDPYSWTIDEIPLSRKTQADLNASSNQQEVRNLRAALGVESYTNAPLVSGQRVNSARNSDVSLG